MNRRLLLASSTRVLTRYKLRSFLMSLGIIVGVAALVVTRSIGASAEQDMMDKMERMFSASSLFVMNSGSASANAIGLSRLALFGSTPFTIKARIVCALARASARVMSGYLPMVSRRRSPSMR